jgi:hypothetical protein
MATQNEAFAECSQLAIVNLGDGLVKIGVRAFQDGVDEKSLSMYCI